MSGGISSSSWSEGGRDLVGLIIAIKVLLDVVLGIVGLGLLMLVIPVEYRIDTKMDDFVRAKARVSTFWSALVVLIEYQPQQAGIRIRLAGIPIWQMDFGKKRESVRNSTKKQEPPSKKKAPRKRTRWQRSIKDFLQREFLRDVGSFLKSMVRVAKPRQVELRGTYGFEDPSWTGILCGLLPMASIMMPSCNIALEPKFDDEVIDITAHVTGRILPAAVAARVLRFILKKSTRHVLFRRRKKRRT